MTKQLEKFILKTRAWCEFPGHNGSAMCLRRASKLIEIASTPATHYVAVCDDCALYAEKEKSFYAKAREGQGKEEQIMENQNPKPAPKPPPEPPPDGD